MASYLSIWQDYPILPDAVAGQEYQYRIKKGNDIIFEGVTVPITNNSVPPSVNITRLVESYLSTPDLIMSPTQTWRDLGSLTVSFYKVSGVTEILKGTYNFNCDWSGINLSQTSNIPLNEPINGHGNPNMKLIFSVYKSNSDTNWKMTTTTATSSFDTTFGNPTYDLSYYIPNVLSTAKTVTFKKGYTSLFTYDQTYCGNGAIYYRNRWGGWDSFLIEGNVYKSDSYEKEQFTSSNVLNTDQFSWDKRTNKIKISSTYEVHTGWLTDEESERLVFHLMSSPDVYFQPFENNILNSVYAVNITNSTAEYKKFRNGRKLNNYTISLEESKKQTVKI